MLNGKKYKRFAYRFEKWVQKGSLHVECGCNVDPPPLYILKVLWKNDYVL